MTDREKLTLIDNIVSGSINSSLASGGELFLAERIIDVLRTSAPPEPNQELEEARAVIMTVMDIIGYCDSFLKKYPEED